MTCGDCKHYFDNKAEEGQQVIKQCRAHPLQLTHLMSKNGPISIGEWPPTQPENRGCGEHAPSLEFAQ
jgi:hypothetical protein